ncbi:MAG: hypothetical protein U0Q15_12735 [Kineosporiaceae bacterium]
MSVARPTPSTRWRCTACGNLTRFDLTRSSLVVEYVHVDLAGQARVEETTVVEDQWRQVRCRWCDGVDTVELVDRNDAVAQTAGRTVEEAAAEEDAAAGIASPGA